ncbi:hypothetical protein V3H21_02125 [Vibrio parahaemolyticus]|uniref:hypothetical protein n=1 Tax=Vibrio parahaemolyticus TaxID=670 RepID=UPI003B6810DC
MKPVLDHLDMASGGKGTMNTRAAINLILMIIAHESGSLLTQNKCVVLHWALPKWSQPPSTGLLSG